MNNYKTYILLLSIALIFSCKKKDKDECPVCPIVESVSPTVGHKGDVVTITGRQFAGSKNIVKFNGFQATVISENTNEVKAMVPSNCGIGAVTVDIDDELTSNTSVNFSYVYKYTVTTFAGTPGLPGDLDGIAASSKFNSPKGIVADRVGNVYVADRSNNCIRKISAGNVTTFAGKKGLTGGFVNSANPLLAEFNFPYGIDINNSGELYVADLFNDCIRKILPSGAVSTLCGKGAIPGDVDGIGSNAQFNWPSDVTIFQDSILFVTDYLNNKVRRVSANGLVKTIAGKTLAGNANGLFDSTKFTAPLGLTMMDANSLLVVDNGNVKIRALTFATKTSTDFAGNGVVGAFNARATASTFNYPTDIAIRTVGGKKEIFVADQSNNVIRLIDVNLNVSTVIGDNSPGFKNGEGLNVKLNRPYGLTFDPLDNSILYITDEFNHCIRKVVIE